MLRTRLTRRVALAGVIGALAAVGAAGPALATTTDALIDTSLIGGQTHFGNSFTQGHPTAPGHLNWNENGVDRTPKLDGNVYVQSSTGVTSRVKLEIYEAAGHAFGDWVATKQRTDSTVGGGGLDIFGINAPPLGNATCECDHVHVLLQDDRNGTFQTVPGGTLILNR